MADALRSGRSPFTRVKVQVLSSAPLFSSKSSVFPHFFPVFPVSFANCLPKRFMGFLCFHVLAQGLRPERSARSKRKDMELWSAHTSAGGRQGTDYTDVYDRSEKTVTTTTDLRLRTVPVRNLPYVPQTTTKPFKRLLNLILSGSRRHRRSRSPR